MLWGACCCPAGAPAVQAGAAQQTYLEASIGVAASGRQVSVGYVSKIQLADPLREAEDGVRDALWGRLPTAVVEFDAPVLLWAARVVAGAHDQPTCWCFGRQRPWRRHRDEMSVIGGTASPYRWRCRIRADIAGVAKMASLPTMTWQT